ncbi:uncharacterized protein [Ptychodera flava]|uniref:uncharacterized protein n=1 Tax=Ptychodera flava TaxID=63121 RepID=UPI00396A27A7
MTKLTKKAEEIVTSNTPLQPNKIDSLKATIASMATKIKEIKALDEQILNEIENDDDYNREFEEADDYVIKVNEDVQILQPTDTSSPIPESTHASQPPDSSQQPTRKVNLPKLTLTPFNGDILAWQSFKDGFDAAVHNDTSLSGVQKFQYLWAHLRDKAERAIQGLPLTNDHYLQAVDVLTKRYGKPQTIINAYIKALWQLEKPTGTLNSLVTFHDNMEGYICGLNALGKSDDTFGDLLILIILEKVPANVRKQISRDKGDEAWTLTSIRESIQREIEANRADCKSKFKCQVCKRKHHTAICTGETPKHPAATRDDVRTLVSSDVSRNSSMLLKTAIADIKARGSTMSESATLLFDDRSQRSFITERTARAIGIDFNNCDSELINVSTLGAKSTGLRSMKIAEITVIIPNGCNVNIRALIVPQITTPLRNHLKSSASIVRLSYLRELELAHPVSDAYDFEVSILVGADFYYSFVGDHVIRGQGPTAVSSKLWKAQVQWDELLESDLRNEWVKICHDYKQFTIFSCVKEIEFQGREPFRIR